MDFGILQALIAGGGLIAVVLISEAIKPRNELARRKGAGRSYEDASSPAPADHGHGHAHGYSPTPYLATDEELHRKVDAIAEQLGRKASVWTKLGWGAIGFALTYGAEHFLNWWFQV